MMTAQNDVCFLSDLFTDNDEVLFALAVGVAESIRERNGTIATVCPESRCPDCRWFLISLEKQDMPFCWGCTTDRENAQIARALLTRVRMKAAGIELVPQGREMFGMPL